MYNVPCTYIKQADFCIENNFGEYKYVLTAHVWVSGPDLAPQKFLLSQQFRYLMRCKKILEKFFYIA